MSARGKLLHSNTRQGHRLNTLKPIRKVAFHLTGLITDADAVVGEPARSDDLVTRHHPQREETALAVEPTA